MLMGNNFQQAISLILGIAFNLCTGTIYIIGVYGPTLKEKLHYSERSITLTETFGVFGLYTGLLGGLIYDKIGNKKCCFLGAGLVFLLYIQMYIVSSVDKEKKWFPDPLTWGTFYILGQAQHLLFVIAIATNIHNFSDENRGKITGVLSAAAGISGAVWAVIYHHVGLENFFLTLGITLSSLGFIGAFMLRKIKYKNSNSSAQIELSNFKSGEAEEEKGINVDNSDITGLDLIKNLDFWLLFFVMAMEDAAATMFISKHGEMILALKRDNIISHAHIGIAFSIASAVGRLSWGFISDFLVKWVSRVFVLMLTIFGMTGAILYIIIFPENLFSAGIAVGYFFGGLFSLGPNIVSSFFGLKYFGTNWGLLLTGPALGTFGFGLVFTLFYENKADASGYCTGVHCYRRAFIFAFVLLMFGCGAAVWLTFRTYRKTKLELIKNIIYQPIAEESSWEDSKTSEILQEIVDDELNSLLDGDGDGDGDDGDDVGDCDDDGDGGGCGGIYNGEGKGQINNRRNNNEGGSSDVSSDGGGDGGGDDGSDGGGDGSILINRHTFDIDDNDIDNIVQTTGFLDNSHKKKETKK